MRLVTQTALPLAGASNSFGSISQMQMCCATIIVSDMYSAYIPWVSSLIADEFWLRVIKIASRMCV